MYYMPTIITQAGSWSDKVPLLPRAPVRSNEDESPRALATTPYRTSRAPASQGHVVLSA